MIVGSEDTNIVYNVYFTFINMMQPKTVQNVNKLHVYWYHARIPLNE